MTLLGDIIREITAECEKRGLTIIHLETRVPPAVEVVWHGSRIQIQGLQGPNHEHLLDVIRLFPEESVGQREG